MKKLLSVALVSIMAISMAACASPNQGGQPAATGQDPSFRFMLACNQGANNPIAIGMNMFADLVYEKTGGSVYIDVFTDGVLGEEGDTTIQVQAGTLDLVRTNVASVVPIVDELGVFMLPFIFSSDTHRHAVLDGEIGQGMGAVLEQYNFVLLQYWEAGSRNFYTSSRPIRSVEDLPGMMIRVQPVEMAIRMIEALGAAAVPMPFAEVYTALQTGVMDGAENDFVSYYIAGHFEVAPYFTLSGHMAPPALVLMNLDAWNQLTPSQQEAMQSAAYEASRWQRQAMMDFQNDSRARVEAAGAEIIYVDVAPFQAAMASVYAMYPQFADMIEAIMAVEY